MARKKTGPTGAEGASPRGETAEETPRGYSIYSEKAEKAAAGAEDAALIGEVDAAIARGGDTAPAEAAEPPAPGASIFAEAPPRAPMTPEEAARETAEDAELLGAVDDAVARGKEVEPEAAPATASRPEERRMPETVAARPAPEPRRDAPYTPPPAPPAKSGSWAGRLLGALLLLLIGAGLALWLGPRLAPNLPAPIAKFLEPGGSETEAKLAALDQSVAELRAELAGRPAGVTEDQVNSAVSGAATRLDGEITALRDEIGAGAGLPERVARVESAVQGTQAEMAALKDQLPSSNAQAAAAPQLDVYKGEVEGLRAEMGTLSDQVAGLRSRVDEVAAEAQRQIDTAQRTVDTVQEQAAEAVDTATRQADVAAVSAALAAGQPFAEPLGRLGAMPDVTIPEGLTAAADQGVPTLAQLRASFPEAAHAAIRASIVAGAGDGIADRALALVRAQFATRSLKPEDGAGPDAVVSRMGAKLDNDDLAGAVAEADALPSEAKDAMGDWLHDARLRVDANEGLNKLESATPATN
ncbi:COG4223 family protein [Amaricoccus solimangrovi]|uniref:Inner membrane protein n=1 Tax=Amaricoccus solimangrovi TaxID=2589815 RepID=A0A501WMG9_9RHOB|nr:mitofilin family membrane protein [Amaricoccus solimangrovi]TPE49384.1 hypothetical protein FJM51_14760 [Amaricoccus solimangrovi]